MKTLVERVGLFLIIAACAYVLHGYGGLRYAAAWLIGGAFVIVAMWLWMLLKSVSYKPYKLIIGVDFQPLWEDLKLVPAEGQTFENFTFTALNATVFACSGEQQYSTRVSFYKRLPCGANAWTPTFGEITTGPTFYFRPSSIGHQFGLNVQEEWWEQHKQQLRPALRDLPRTYGGDVILAELPEGYIPDHVRQWNEPVTLWGGFDRKQRFWEKRLKTLGWTFDQNYPTYITHRYLRLQYLDI